MRLLGYATIAAAAMGLTLAHALPAAAAQFNVTFDGTIDGAPGTTFSVTFRLDASAPDQDPANPSFGVYDAIHDLHGSVSNGLSFSASSSSSIGVANNKFVPNTFIDVVNGSPDVTGSGFELNGEQLSQFRFAFCCSTSMLSSDAIPDFTTLLSLSSDHGVSFLFEAPDQDPSELFGTITAVSVSPIAATPVPPALPLFATALAGLGIAGWRRSKRARRSTPIQA